MIISIVKKRIFEFSLFGLFTILYFSSTVGIMNSGDAPQYALTQSLVEEKTIKIDHFSKWIFPDFAVFNSHYYSGRSFGESLLAIPFYLLARISLPIASYPYGSLSHLGIHEESKLESVTILYNATFGAGVVVLLYLICLRLTNNAKFPSLITAFTAGAGTLLWKYSSVFQRQPVAIFFLLFAYLLFLHSFTIKKISLKNCVLFFNIFRNLIYCRSITSFCYINIVNWIYFFITNNCRSLF